jgi:hypothetical protein
MGPSQSYRESKELQCVGTQVQSMFFPGANEFQRVSLKLPSGGLILKHGLSYENHMKTGLEKKTGFFGSCADY